MSSSTYSYTEDQTLPIPDASEMRFGVIVTEWEQSHHGQKLLQGTIEELEKNGVEENNITVKRVPGSFDWFLCRASQLAKFGHVNELSSSDVSFEAILPTLMTFVKALRKELRN